MSICIHIHFRHDFTDWGDYDRSAEYVQQAAAKLRIEYGFNEDQVKVWASTDADEEDYIEEMKQFNKEEGLEYTQEDEALDRKDFQCDRYGIHIEEPLFMTCRLENGFWDVWTTEPYSALFNPDSDIVEFIKRFVRTLDGKTAYVTEEMGGWSELGDPELSFDEWLEIHGSPHIIEVD